MYWTLDIFYAKRRGLCLNVTLVGSQMPYSGASMMEHYVVVTHSADLQYYRGRGKNGGPFRIFFNTLHIVELSSGKILTYHPLAFFVRPSHISQAQLYGS